MLGLLWLIPALPFAGFAILALLGPVISRTLAAVVGVGSVGLAALITLLVGADFMASAGGHGYSQTLWSWMDVGGFNPGITLYLDSVSLLFVVVITFVGFLIHLYSAEYMADDEGYSRFFAYMNLFVGSMLTLVLADNLLLLFLGWEGVGLCSFLLIGFWYRDPYNGYAARKAFVVTRVGDTALLVGMFLLFNNLGTLQIQELMQRAGQSWPVGSSLAVAAALLILGGAVGKSAQLPLQTWLPDAMAGPTPVSALIHAATMVTAGVYLIARTNAIFLLAPSVLQLVAIVGALTLLIAGFAALAQTDLKRVLAYSTISQIGYMFLGLGVGSWSAALFHFFTHAFFKALLFLGAGVIILALHHEQDMHRMGGLRKSLPLTFWTFLIGAASLAALPWVTAGFYSKDMILTEAWVSGPSGQLLAAAGFLGALVTSMYTFRMVFITFFGRERTHVTRRPELRISAVLVILAFGALAAGLLELPKNILGGLPILSGFLHSALPAEGAHEVSTSTEWALQIVSALLSLGGIYVAYLLYYRTDRYAEDPSRAPWGAGLNRFWRSGWGFDSLYDLLFVRPYVAFARINKGDFINAIYEAVAGLNVLFHRVLSSTESGIVRWYAAGIAAGAIIAVAIGVIR
ncbi:MAG TPA: NADH-quinone oxidoreductase subunit L [Chloroflexota bacterium]|nr:NADH-quinone oxidoreductase subunit L [Chloroflexota bacterium]